VKKNRTFLEHSERDTVNWWLCGMGSAMRRPVGSCDCRCLQIQPVTPEDTAMICLKCKIGCFDPFCSLCGGKSQPHVCACGYQNLTYYQKFCSKCGRPAPPIPRPDDYTILDKVRDESVQE